MTWLTPWLAGIAAGIAIPSLVILYFLKLRRRDVEISTTLLWKKAIEDLQANAPFQRLRRNILLLLQLLALGAALVAVGQPQIKGDSPVGAKHVILIDRSASMSALDAKNEGGEMVSRLDKELSRLYVYASMLSDEDTRDSTAQGKQQEMQQLYARFGAEASFVEPEIVKMGSGATEKALATEPRLSSHVF
jgi:hypothetical protein